LVDAFGIDVVGCDEFSVVGDDAGVAVVDEEEDVAAFVGASDTEVAEFAGVAEGDFAGLVDAVAADAELAGVADRLCGGRGLDSSGVDGAGCSAVVGAVGPSASTSSMPRVSKRSRPSATHTWWPADSRRRAPII
jgi:hypothetical protein